MDCEMFEAPNPLFLVPTRRRGNPVGTRRRPLFSGSHAPAWESSRDAPASLIFWFSLINPFTPRIRCTKDCRCTKRLPLSISCRGNTCLPFCLVQRIRGVNGWIVRCLRHRILFFWFPRAGVGIQSGCAGVPYFSGSHAPAWESSRDAPASLIYGLVARDASA